MAHDDEDTCPGYEHLAGRAFVVFQHIDMRAAYQTGGRTRFTTLRRAFLIGVVCLGGALTLTSSAEATEYCTQTQCYTSTGSGQWTSVPLPIAPPKPGIVPAPPPVPSMPVPPPNTSYCDSAQCYQPIGDGHWQVQSAPPQP